MAGDNGEAGAEGQRPQRAFPKGFAAVFASFLSSVFRGLAARINPVHESGFQQGFAAGNEPISSSASN
jgi:hypothetical protein